MLLTLLILVPDAHEAIVLPGGGEERAVGRVGQVDDGVGGPRLPHAVPVGRGGVGLRRTRSSAATAADFEGDICEVLGGKFLTKLFYCSCTEKSDGMVIEGLKIYDPESNLL